MSASNTTRSYGSVTKTFHWLTVLLILAAIPLGIIANGLAYDTSEALAFKAFLFSMHKTVGITAFFVALARIFWALSQPKPAGLHPERRAESFLAELVH
jgi:cytochrome b561